jgi:predicted phage baseplate assembly protein
MALPTPNLDDRRFQDLVDDAKRGISQRCPEWTDHNVSDPGVTLIELFASMTDQLLYRLNRVPDRNYVKFLELIGVRLFPPTAARTDVTFWLSAPQEGVITIPAGTEVSTDRDRVGDVIGFATTRDLPIVPCSLLRVGTAVGDGRARDQTEGLQAGVPFPCFTKAPKPDDALLIGLSDPVPSCAVVLRFGCRIEGVGVDPRNPPIAWEAWSGERWARCEVDTDDTGGLNKDGDVILHVSSTHEASVIAGERAAWIRCRVLGAEEGQPSYSASPHITELTAFTVGGTVESMNAELVEEEVVGVSNGVPGQRFPLSRAPIVQDEGPRVLEVSGDDGWQDWTEVGSFGESGPDARHFMLDAVGGELVLGPAVREADGSLTRYGAVPARGAILRLRSLRTGGGRRGNVASGALRILRSSIPYVTRVENRHPARGGVDGEDIENAKIRGPILLRTGNRAVTAEDYEQLAREAAPEVARVRCMPAGDGADPGSVRVLVVPATGREGGRLRFEQLIPQQETVERIAGYLDERRVIGVRGVVEPPEYQGVTVVAKLRARPRTDPRRLERDALEALYDYLDPIFGGPEGRGWPFGRPVLTGDVYSVLQRVRGTDLVEEARLFAADPTTGRRGKEAERIELGPYALVFSYEHQVLAEAP